MYEIDEDIQAILDNADPETGEINLDVLETLQKEKEEKIEGVLLGYKNAKAEAEMLKKIEADYAARRKAAEKRAEGLKVYLSENLKGEKFKTPMVSAYWKETEFTDIKDASLIPVEFIKQKEPEFMLTEIKKAIKEGVKVPGAEIGHRSSLQIK
jgi:hypothetical protein